MHGDGSTAPSSVAEMLNLLWKMLNTTALRGGNVLPSWAQLPITPMHHPLIRLCCQSKFKLLQKFMVQPHKSSPSALLLCPLCQSTDYCRSWLHGEKYFPNSIQLAWETPPQPWPSYGAVFLGGLYSCKFICASRGCRKGQRSRISCSSTEMPLLCRGGNQQ